jgi:hypothetical protein
LFDQRGHPVVPTCASLVPTRTAARSVLDGREHDGTLDETDDPGTLHVAARRASTCPIVAVCRRIFAAANIVIDFVE